MLWKGLGVSVTRPDEILDASSIPWPTLIKIVLTTVLVTPPLVYLVYCLYITVEGLRDRIWDKYGRRK